MSQREVWSSKIGFILAAAGSAVGLGNIWKFPYITGVHGGGAFVLVYLIAILLVGLPIMIAEIYIGKTTQKNPVGAFKDVTKNSNFLTKLAKLSPIAGFLGVLSGILILSFYSVVAGWTLHFLFLSFKGFSGSKEVIEGHFNHLYSTPSIMILWHTILMIIVVLIILKGVQKGIEKASKIMMPLLIFILFTLMIYSIFNGGSGEAFRFMFYPDFSKLNAEAIIQALGHAFFTLSLGMGVMITYGSYLKNDISIVKSSVLVSFIDTFIALLAGMVIFPIVFSSGLEASSGPSLIFKTLPTLFAKITSGSIISIMFFLLLFFAALTSAISLLEVVVVYFVDERKWSRKKGTIILGVTIYLLGVLSAIPKITIGKESVLDFLDNVTTKYMLPFGGLLTILIFAYFIPLKSIREELKLSKFIFYSFVWICRVVTPTLLIWVILNKIGFI